MSARRQELGAPRQLAQLPPVKVAGVKGLGAGVADVVGVAVDALVAGDVEGLAGAQRDAPDRAPHRRPRRLALVEEDERRVEGDVGVARWRRRRHKRLHQRRDGGQAGAALRLADLLHQLLPLSRRLLQVLLPLLLLLLMLLPAAAAATKRELRQHLGANRHEHQAQQGTQPALLLRARGGHGVLQQRGSGSGGGWGGGWGGSASGAAAAGCSASGDSAAPVRLVGCNAGPSNLRRARCRRAGLRRSFRHASNPGALQGGSKCARCAPHQALLEATLTTSPLCRLVGHAGHGGSAAG